MFKIIAIVVIGVFVVIGGFMILDPNINTNLQGNNTTQVVEENSNKITITIEGEVVKTGSYTFDQGLAISYEMLIEKAGGLNTNADERAFYYDSTVENGNTYYVSSLYDAADVCSKAAINKVNINEDNADQLMAISGITSSIANSIVSYRTSNGAFKTIEQLTDVYGIGNATYRKIRNYVILHN